MVSKEKHCECDMLAANDVRVTSCSVTLVKSRSFGGIIAAISRFKIAIALKKDGAIKLRCLIFEN